MIHASTIALNATVPPSDRNTGSVATATETEHGTLPEASRGVTLTGGRAQAAVGRNDVHRH